MLYKLYIDDDVDADATLLLHKRRPFPLRDQQRCLSINLKNTLEAQKWRQKCINETSLTQQRMDSRKRYYCYFCLYCTVPCNYFFIMMMVMLITVIITNNVSYHSHAMSAALLVVFFLSLIRMVGNPSFLKILFVLFWQWWEAGNWTVSRSMIHNTPHFQPKWKYMASALADSSSSLPWSSSPFSPFHLLTSIFLFILSLSRLVSCLHPFLFVFLPLKRYILSLLLTLLHSTPHHTLSFLPPSFHLCVWVAYLV